ncbi:MAG: GrpB family protein [Thermoleophilaceae bacterium]
MTDQIEVVAYDPQWPTRFLQQSGAIRATLGEVALRIDHIGSSAVPGLAAKPIIDVQISVAALEPPDAFRVPLEQLGYVFRADNLERTKRYFREPPGARRTHLHVRRAGSFSEQLALLFRDFMRTHPDWAQRYAELKYGVAERHAGDRERYIQEKQPFTWEAIAAADEWAQRTGWLPGPSDA